MSLLCTYFCARPAGAKAPGRGPRRAPGGPPGSPQAPAERPPGGPAGGALFLAISLNFAKRSQWDAKHERILLGLCESGEFRNGLSTVVRF